MRNDEELLVDADVSWVDETAFNAVMLTESIDFGPMMGDMAHGTGFSARC